MLFRIFCLALPVILFLFMEAGLRLAGFGAGRPVFRNVGTTKNGKLVVTDQGGAADYFFASRGYPGKIIQYNFFQPKDANTVRIFVVGESAARGFPQPRNLASSAFLEAMLRDVWPRRKVEVINLGITAVASYPVLEVMNEALQYSPDLIIVYTGHNEFFGAYGVASVGWGGSNPWTLRFTRFFNSLALVQTGKKVLAPGHFNTPMSLMEKMVGQAYIAPDDWRRNAAKDSLYRNVREMLARCQARGIPVILCTQPSNERNIAPIGQYRFAGIPEDKQQEFERHINLGSHLLAAKPALALIPFQSACGLIPDHARAHFFRGQALFALHRYREAQEAFTRARDLDPMPWRATSSINETLRSVAREFKIPVCDLEAVFRANSHGGSIGWELMNDTVHPVLRGQALVAEAVTDSLTRFSGPLAVSSAAYNALAGWQAYAGRLGDNKYDRCTVAYRMHAFFGLSYMRSSNPDAVSRFKQLAAKIEGTETPDIQNMLRNNNPFDRRPITARVARAFMLKKKYAEAFELYKIAQRSVPFYTPLYMEYVYLALLCREKLNGSVTAAERLQAMEAIEQGRVLLRYGFPDAKATRFYLGRLLQLCGATCSR